MPVQMMDSEGPMLWNITKTGYVHPVKQPPRHLPFHIREETDRLLEHMLRRGMVEPPSSPCASGVVLVKKKAGSTRFCVNDRRLNSFTRRMHTLSPESMTDSLSGASWFSTLDLCLGLWNLVTDQKLHLLPVKNFSSLRSCFSAYVTPEPSSNN